MRARVACGLALLGLCGLSACGDDADALGPTCLVRSVEREIAITRFSAVDLLFVVDDGPSMAGEQALLQAWLPGVLELVPGDTDVHVAVVSSDMGAGGAAWPGCAGLGDDGLFQRGGDCAADRPAFLSFHTPRDVAYHPLFDFDAGSFEPEATLGCLAALGADGCGFSQPLEAALKALWPSVDRDPETGEAIESRIQFHGLGPDAGVLGHGDRDNAGFLRNDPVKGLSAIMVVVVTDKDDCSTADWSLFQPVEPEVTAPSARCAHEPGPLYSLDRYANGLRALRPGAEQLVLFSVLAGVPTELSGAAAREALEAGDFEAYEAHYQALLDHPDMQLQVETRDGVERVASVCENDAVRAEPARRLVKVAQRFEQSGGVHSICDPDWDPVMLPLQSVLSKSFGPICHAARSPLDDGVSTCQLLWELPPPELAPEGTPTDCEAEFLSPADDPMTARGGARCVVRRLEVTGEGDAAVLEPGQGWFHDTTDPCRDLAFTPEAQPATGTTMKLQCQEVRYSLAPREDLDPTRRQPWVLGPCAPEEEDACAWRLRDRSGGERGDGLDRELVCHAERALCVLPCDDAPCPDGWSCNRDDALPHCEPGECRVP